MHVHNNPFGLGEVFDDEMSEEDPSESEQSGVVDGGSPGDVKADGDSE